jgi:hypothetical protein
MYSTAAWNMASEYDRLPEDPADIMNVSMKRRVEHRVATTRGGAPADRA